MITASIVTYEHHLLDIEPVLRSLFASPVDIVYIIDHSETMMDLKDELQAFATRVLRGEPDLRKKINRGFRLLYFPHENNGYGGGHNYALKMAINAGSTYHLVVNPDIWFGPEVVPQLIDHMNHHPEVGQMMPRVFFPNGKEQRLVKLLPTPLDIFCRLCLPPFLFIRRNARFELRHSNYTFNMNAPFLSGCFMFLRISAVVDIDFFDERFFLYAEDIDFSRRMHEKYETLFFPQVCIYHKFSRASHKSLRMLFIHTKSICQYFNKWGWWRDKDRKQINKKCLAEIDEHNSNLI